MQADFIAPAIGVPLVFRFWEPTETEDQDPEPMDVSGASSWTVKMKRPTGEEVELSAALVAGETAAVEHITGATDFPADLEGDYEFHAIAEDLNGVTMASSPVARLFVKSMFSKR